MGLPGDSTLSRSFGSGSPALRNFSRTRILTTDSQGTRLTVRRFGASVMVGTGDGAGTGRGGAPGSAALRGWQAYKSGTATSTRGTIMSPPGYAAGRTLLARHEGKSRPLIPYGLRTSACFLPRTADTNPLGPAGRLLRRCAAVGQRGGRSREPLRLPAHSAYWDSAPWWK